MPDANTADFFGGGSLPLPPVKPPPRDPKVVAAERARVAEQTRRRIEAERIANLEKVKAKKLADQKWQRDYEARMRTEQSPEAERWRAQEKKIKSAGVDWGLIPAGAAVIGTGVAIIATGGAVAGGLGVGAAASTAAAATTASTAINTATKAAKVTGGIARGNVGSAAGAASTALGAAGVKAPPLPSAAKLGSEAMAGLSLKVPKLKVPNASDALKKAKATAKQSATAVAKTASTAAKKTATQAVKAATKTGTASIMGASMVVQTAAQKAAATAASGKAKIEGAKKLLAGKPAAPKAKPLTLVKTASLKAVTGGKVIAPPKLVTPKGITATPPKPQKMADAAPQAQKVPKPAASGAPATKGKPQKGIFIPLSGIVDFKTREWVAAG